MKENLNDLLVKIPMFANLDDSELGVVSSHIRPLDVGQGEVLFKEGQSGDYVCFVVNGRLEVLKKTISGEDFVLNTLARGQSVGEMAIIEKKPRSATVKARTEANLITLSHEDFETIMRDHNQIGTKILRGLALLMSRKLRQSSSRLANYMAAAV